MPEQSTDAEDYKNDWPDFVITGDPDYSALLYAPAGVKPNGDYMHLTMDAEGNVRAVLTDADKDDIARRVVEQLRPILEMETGIKDG